MNILDSSAIRKCTSCQMCAAVCPKGAITIELDMNGFYRPIVDDAKCVDCSICTKVCYKFDTCISVSDNQKLNSTILYGGFVKDPELLNKTTSGGIADLLAHQLVKDGYKCVGVVYDSENDKAKDIIASHEYELKDFKGSKYIQSYTFSAFKEIVKTCKTEKYAVFGTPCHIYALDRFLKIKKVRDNFVLIDLYCHGCPSMNVWKKFIKEVKIKTRQSKIDYVNFRSKIKGWGNFYVVVVVDGKPIYYSSDDKNNDFYDLFFSDYILNEACHDCKLRSTLDYTDIRLGDFWGKQYVLNNKGVSAISLVSDRARSLFSEISSYVSYQQEKYDDFLPWQSWGKIHAPNQSLRELMLKQLQDEKVPLHETVVSFKGQQTFVTKMIGVAKSFVHLLPLSFEKHIRWLFYHIKK